MALNPTLILLYTGIFATICLAQLSPGDLSSVHADLEGLKNCTRCHEAGKKVSSENCLKCHVILRERIDAGVGLHSGENFNACETCHSEHQGRDYKLIWWREGQEKFDHGLTGYKLQGKHRTLACRSCHKAAFISDMEKYIGVKKNPDRTYLGLERACHTCHFDEHRGQLDTRCESCHGQESWRPAEGFDHNKTSFPLTGKHHLAECRSCHPPVSDEKSSEDKEYLQFGKIEYRSCRNCHKDAHQGRLGKNCKSCHTTNGWRDKNSSKFNHDRTRYPLAGRHAEITCIKCHPKNRPLRIQRFDTCLSCHNDYHRGQFKARPGRGDCEECHTVAGFSPANFVLANHQKTEFQLAGAHLAVPCNACHKKDFGNGTGRTMRFSFEKTACADCHRDVHNGEVDTYLQKTTGQGNTGCAFCHTVEGWNDVSFDHSLTRFDLKGRHDIIACVSCHLTESGSGVRLKNIPQDCQACHKDAHAAQFARPGGEGTDCGICHAPVDWLAEKFDHNRDSKFILEGRHRSLKCERCHPREISGDLEFTRYKPIAMSCVSCHSDKDQAVER